MLISLLLVNVNYICKIIFYVLPTIENISFYFEKGETENIKNKICLLLDKKK